MDAYVWVNVLFGTATLTAVVLMGIFFTANNERQTRALTAVRSALEDRLMFLIMERRERKLREIHVTDAYGWIGAQAGIRPVSLHRNSPFPQAVSFHAPGGMRVVMSPLPPDQLRGELKRQESSRGRAGELIDRLLGIHPRRVTLVERSLVNAGEWFDIEAEQVVKLLDLDWDKPSRLWFYLVPTAQKR